LSEIPQNENPKPAPTQPLLQSAAAPVEEEAHLAEVHKNPPILHRDDDHQQQPRELAQSVDISGKGDSCSFTGNEYALQWSYNRLTDAVEFVMSQKRKMGRWWSAVGIVGDKMSVTFHKILLIS
jgi:hypothetical protein